MAQVAKNLQEFSPQIKHPTLPSPWIPSSSLNVDIWNFLAAGDGSKSAGRKGSKFSLRAQLNPIQVLFQLSPITPTTPALGRHSLDLVPYFYYHKPHREERNQRP